jgi:hypothetical protein
MHDHAPNGYFAQDLIIFDDLIRGGSVAQGFVIRPPSLTDSSANVKRDMRERIVNWLRQLTEHQRAQCQWRVSSDYRAALEAYDRVTEGTTNPTVKAYRCARSRVLWKKLRERKLRLEECVLFVATKIHTAAPTGATKTGLVKYYESLITQQRTSYDQMLETLRLNMGGDVQVEPMADFDHFVFCWRWANPSRDEEPATNLREIFDPSKSIQELVWNSDISPVAKVAFYQDSHYHQVLTLKNVGAQGTKMGMVTNLTALPFLNYSISVNLTPINPEKEMDREERAMQRLINEQRTKYSAKRDSAITAKDAKIKALNEGETSYWISMIIRAWGQNEAQLGALTTALKNATTSMLGAQVYENSLPSSSLKLYYASFPGWCFSSYNARDIYLESGQVAEILPISASFTGDLMRAEALYEGLNNTLVGVSTFEKSDIPSPQMAVCIGTSGSGKSFQILDLFMQTAPYYQDGFTCIIDDGFSQKPYATAHNATTLYITPDTRLCINYLDTHGLPVSRQHMSAATSLACHMSGVPRDEFERSKRKAMLSQYIADLNYNTFQSWIRKHPEQRDSIQREACAGTLWHSQRMTPDDSLMDAYVALMSGIRNNDPEILEFIQAIPADDVLKFAKSPQTERLIVDYAFSKFTPGEYPTHGQLCQLMLATPREEHDQELVKEMSTMLSSWTRTEGHHGGLFDGTTNVSLTGSVVHFELSGISKDEVELKSAVGILLMSYIRQHIISLPKNVWKRVLYEELIKLLRTLPDASTLLEENYGQLRKYNGWALSAMQQFGGIAGTPVAKILMSNTKMFMLLRQNSRTDTNEIADEISVPLPKSMREAISRYPLTDSQPKDKRFGSFCYYNTSTHPLICGTVRNYQPTITESDSQ